MATLDVIDGGGVARETKVAGSGTSGDPFIPSVNVDTVVAGTGATNLGKAEDAAHTSGDTGVMALAVRNDAGSVLAGTTGDYIPLTTDSSGALRVTSGGGSLSANIAGDVAHDGVDSGSPVKIGGYAKATAPSNVSADGDRVNAWFDLAGRLAVQDGGGSLTVDGSVTADTELPAAVALNGTIVKSVSTPVVGAALLVSDNTNLIQPLGDAANGLDVDVTRLPALVAGSAVIGKVSIDQTTPGTTNLVDTELPAAAALADGASLPTTPKVGAVLMAYNGATLDLVRVASKGYDMSAVSITSIATVATPTSGKKIRLLSGSFSVSAAASVLFEDNAGGTTVYRTPKLLADTPYNFDLGAGYLLSAANNVLKATASAAATITGTIRACEE